MRPDMAKVVTEAPRRGHGQLSRKTGRRLTHAEIAEWGEAGNPMDDDADLPPDVRFSSHGRGAPGERLGKRPELGLTHTKESQGGQYGWDSKSFSDVLGPLRKYLRKQVGRPWDAVYSELSQTLDKRSLTGIHIWDHIKSEVQIHTEMWQGEIWATGNYFYRLDGGTRYYRHVTRQLYVHPVTRVLCREKPRTIVARPQKQNADDIPLTKTPDGEVRLQRLNGIWYYVTFREMIERVPGGFTNYGSVSWRRGPSTAAYHEAHNDTVSVVTNKRQLSRADLKKHGVVNDLSAKFRK